MKGAHSISTRRAYGVQRVCRVWHRARSSVYARRQATTSPCRRGPVGVAPDDVLVGHIGRMLEASPFHGEGYRKAWAKLRVEGIRTSQERVRRLMREHDLQAPHRVGHAHGPKAHDGTITTEAPDVMWGTDMTTTVTVRRQWIGIDIAIHAIKRVARIRLNDRCGLVEDRDYEVKGVPRDLEGAKDLWTRDKYHFQKWAVEQVEGFVTDKRTADGGVDGRLYFSVPDALDLQSMVIEVKGGANVNIGDVRALGNVLDRNTALLAGLIVMEDLGPTKTRNFKRLMAEAGDLKILGMKYPRMQMLTVSEIIDGERFITPSVAARRAMKPKLPIG